jgi:hypothetical protein
LAILLDLDETLIPDKDATNVALRGRMQLCGRSTSSRRWFDAVGDR